MAKKKRSGGGGGGGGGGEQQQKPASDAAAAEERQEEEEEHNDAASPDAQPLAKAAAEGKDNAAKKADAPKEKDKDKEKKAVLPAATAVLKVDMHCDGCAKRIRASVRHYPGVEGVAMDVDKGTMTVVGRFDAKKLRDRVAGKTKKKVDLLPANNNNKNTKSNNDGDVKPIKQEEEQDDDKGGHGGGGKAKQGAKDSKKPLMPVVGTVVLKIGAVGLHCDGCMDRIRSKLFHIDGVEQVAMEMAKNQVTVTGTMDVKALPESLRRKLRRPVDVVQPPSSNSKQQKQDGGKDAAAKALAAEKEAWKAAFYDQQALMATEFMLSDENPNACTIT